MSLEAAADPTEPLLSLRQVTVCYGSTVAAADVDLDIPDEPGGIGIIGESGSGKTTLARVLLGLLGPTSGEALFRGRPIATLSRPLHAEFRAQVQPVFQDGNEALDPRMRVGASVAEGLMVRQRLSARAREAAVAALLTDVGLDEALADRLPHELSGGQRQRVIIARALGVRPRLLLMDEPTSALDVTVQAHILELLESLGREQRLGMVLITHNLAVVQRLCATAHVMFAGRIVESGPTTALLTAPRHPYTRALRDAVPELGGPAPTVSERAWQAPAQDGCAFRHRCPLVSAICTRERPELRPMDDRLVACHHSDATGVPTAVRAE